MNKALSWDDAAALAKNCQAKGGLVVATNGCFDILHRGHVEYLRFAKQQGDVLIVGINADSSVRKIKGPSRPIHSEEDRAIVLGALKDVDAVCIFSEDTASEWLHHLRPDIYIKGGDWEVEKIPEYKIMQELGGKVLKGPYLQGHSTTEIIEKTKKGK